MKLFFTLLLAIMTVGVMAQTTANLENYTLEDATYVKDAGSDKGFSDGNIFLPNHYTDVGTYDFWNGWVISNITDNTTVGFLNEGSAITGSGFDGSENYGVSFVSGSSKIHMTGDAIGGTVNGMYVTNSTYAALNMQDGDDFSKAFGGETGNDPDYFLLTVKKWFNGELSVDSVDFYLSDFRFEDNSQDYILNEWTWLDLTSLGAVDSLEFTMTSTDNGAFGMNTPAFFCMDNMITADMLVGTDNEEILTFEISPNPSQDLIFINGKNKETYHIFSNTGCLVKEGKVTKNGINIKTLTNGVYTILLTKDGQRSTSRFVKI